MLGNSLFSKDFIHIHHQALFSRGNGLAKFNSLKILSFGNIDVNLHMLRMTRFLVTPETSPL